MKRFLVVLCLLLCLVSFVYSDAYEDKAALRTALDYIDANLGFSKERLIKQLEFEGFNHTSASNAVNQLYVDWNKQAYLSAKSYQKLNMSYDRIRKQLVYEGFTTSQVTWALDEIQGKHTPEYLRQQAAKAKAQAEEEAKRKEQERLEKIEIENASLAIMQYFENEHLRSDDLDLDLDIDDILDGILSSYKLTASQKMKVREDCKTELQKQDSQLVADAIEYIIQTLEFIMDSDNYESNYIKDYIFKNGISMEDEAYINDKLLALDFENIFRENKILKKYDDHLILENWDRISKFLQSIGFRRFDIDLYIRNLVSDEAMKSWLSESNSFFKNDIVESSAESVANDLNKDTSINSNDYVENHVVKVVDEIQELPTLMNGYIGGVLDAGCKFPTTNISFTVLFDSSLIFKNFGLHGIGLNIASGLFIEPDNVYNVLLDLGFVYRYYINEKWDLRLKFAPGIMGCSVYVPDTSYSFPTNKSVFCLDAGIKTYIGMDYKMKDSWFVSFGIIDRAVFPILHNEVSKTRNYLGLSIGGGFITTKL